MYVGIQNFKAKFKRIVFELFNFVCYNKDLSYVIDNVGLENIGLLMSLKLY